MSGTSETSALYNIPRAAQGEGLDNKKKKMTEAPSPDPEARQLELAKLLLRHVRDNGSLASLFRGAAHFEASPTTLPALAGDILHGADQIAEFLYGDKKHRRKVYRLVEAGKLPHFRLGNNVCSRRSVLVSWIGTQEQSAHGIVAPLLDPIRQLTRR